MEYKGFTYTPAPKTAWDSLSMLEKSEMMKVAIRNGITDLKTIREKYNEYAEGGDTNPAMTGMMKSKLAISAHFGNPTARRMANYDTRSYTWPGEYEYDKGIGEPKRGNVYVGSYGNLITPQIQDNGKGLVFIDNVWSPKNDQRSYMQSLKFDNEADAIYFGEHYKEVAPMMGLYDSGGKIYIKPENRGKFTALKERTGHSATWFKEHGTPAQKKMAIFALNARHWKHGFGGNLFEEAGQMQIGRPFWQSQTQEPTFMESLAEFNRQQDIKKQQQRQALREKINTVGKKLAEERIREASVESNDNAWVDTPLTYKKKNPHLSRKAEEGAKAHAAWEKKHPNLTAWGNVAGALPFAIAAVPLGAGIVAGGDALAATTAGQAITAGLAPLHQAVTSATIAGAPALEWADVGLSSLFGGHGVQTAIDEGGVSPMTALEVASLGRLVKPMYGQTNKWVATSQNPNMQYVRYGLGKAKGFLEGNVPQLPQLYRKVKGIPTIEGGKVILSTPENRFAFENGMGQESPLITNFTTDVGVRRHADGNWNWAPTLSFPGETLLGKRVVSTRPSDTFTYGDVISVPLNRVTAVTGRGKEIDAFENMGINTLSSTDAQSAFANDLTSYVSKAQKLRANNAKILKAKAEGKPTFKRKWPEKDFDNYASEIQQLTRGNFRSPTVKDYEFMDYVFNPQYSSEVVPKLSLEEDIVKYPSLVGSWYGDSGRRRYIANPDEWVNVIYDPYSPAEDLFRKSKGIDLKPEWQNK